MDIKQYFDEMLPEESDSYYCTAIFLGKFPKGTRFTKSKAELVKIITDWQKSPIEDIRQSETYIAMSSFNGMRRNQETAEHIKSLFIDIDCKGLKTAKADKEYHYETKEKALDAINIFVNTMNLPIPTVVNSGYGLHVYWAFEKSISTAEWKPLANQLKLSAMKHDLRHDVSVCTNEAGFLRPTGTTNFKDENNPIPVEVIQKGKVVSVDHIKKVLQSTSSSADLFAKVRRDMKQSATGILAGSYANFDFSFKKIIKRTIKNEKEGCAHIKYMLEKANEVKEPYWRAGISIAAHCVEEKDAVILLSKNHKEYNEEETLAKMENYLSTNTFAYTCSKIHDIAPAENSKLCGVCKHKGKIGSPILLGKIIPTQEAKNENITERNAETDEIVTYVLPNSEDLPNGYVRGNNNSILKEALDDDDDPTIVYPHPIYGVKRLDDPGEGQSLWMRLHTKMDGINEFMVPYTTIVSMEECKKFFAAKGVIPALPSHQKQLQQYIMDYANMLRDKQKLEQLHVQFGWKDEYKKFVIGVKEFDGEVINYTPPASTMNNLLEYFKTSGSLEKWKETFNLYNKPGYEAQGFSLMSGFGAPLLEFTNTKGVILHLTSADSGAGKSTIQRYINSLYGSPDMGLVHHDTKLSSFHTFGVLRNLPFCIDEVTDMKPEAVSDLAYAITHGRARNRMSASSNKLRENKSTWKSILVTTGNSSFYDKLAEHTEFSDGEMMRVFEIRIPSVSSTEQQDDRYNDINDNYGYAGEFYIQEVIKNIDKLKQRIIEKKEQIRKDFGLISKERFWTDLIAVNLVGGEFAKEIGLHSFDIDKIYEWLKDNIDVIRRKTEITQNELLGYIGVYMNEHENNQLVVDGTERNKNLWKILKEPRGSLYIRVEEDVNRVYFNATHFRKWCSQKRIPYSDVMDKAKNENVLLSTKKKRLGTGHIGNSSAPGVMANEFDASKLTTS